MSNQYTRRLREMGPQRGDLVRIDDYYGDWVIVWREIDEIRPWDRFVGILYDNGQFDREELEQLQVDLPGYVDLEAIEERRESDLEAFADREIDEKLYFSINDRGKFCFYRRAGVEDSQEASRWFHQLPGEKPQLCPDQKTVPDKKTCPHSAERHFRATRTERIEPKAWGFHEHPEAWRAVMLPANRPLQFR